MHGDTDVAMYSIIASLMNADVQIAMLGIRIENDTVELMCDRNSLI